MKHTYHTVPNTRGRARYYKTKTKRKGFVHKTTLPKKIAGNYRHLYIKK